MSDEEHMFRSSSDEVKLVFTVVKIVTIITHTYDDESYIAIQDTSKSPKYTKTK